MILIYLQEAQNPEIDPTFKLILVVIFFIVLAAMLLLRLYRVVESIYVNKYNKPLFLNSLKFFRWPIYPITIEALG